MAPVFYKFGGLVEQSNALECTSADFDLSENEFRRLLDRGELTLSTQVGDAGRRAKCVEGSSITVDLRLKRD